MSSAPCNRDYARERGIGYKAMVGYRGSRGFRDNLKISICRNRCGIIRSRRAPSCVIVVLKVVRVAVIVVLKVVMKVIMVVEEVTQHI